MVKELGKDARLYLNHMDIYLKAFEMEQAMTSEVLQSGQYAQDFDDFDIIKAQGEFSLSSYLFDDYKPTFAGPAESLDAFFKEIQIDQSGKVVTTPAILTFSNKALMVPGDWALFMEGFGQVGIAPNKDGLIPITCKITETGPIAHGIFLEIADVNLTNGSPAVNSDTFDFGVGSNTRIRASLHVLDIVVNSGSFTDVEAKIESDTATPVSSGTDRLNFADFTDKTQEFVDVAAVHTERYHRLVLTGTGGTFDINVKVAVAAQVVQ